MSFKLIVSQSFDKVNNYFVNLFVEDVHATITTVKSFQHNISLVDNFNTNMTYVDDNVQVKIL